jgi:hypothetical protein
MRSGGSWPRRRGGDGRLQRERERRVEWAAAPLVDAGGGTDGAEVGAGTAVVDVALAEEAVACGDCPLRHRAYLQMLVDVGEDAEGLVE